MTAQFRAPLVLLLVVAAAVMFALGDHVDAVVIAAVVVVNAAIGFVQERRAGTAIDSLSRSLGVEATVIRDGARMARFGRPICEVIPASRQIASLAGPRGTGAARRRRAEMRGNPRNGGL